VLAQTRSPAQLRGQREVDCLGGRQSLAIVVCVVEVRLAESADRRETHGGWPPREAAPTADAATQGYAAALWGRKVRFGQ
jgi:hypothetical protein